MARKKVFFWKNRWWTCPKMDIIALLSQSNFKNLQVKVEALHLARNKLGFSRVWRWWLVLLCLLSATRRETGDPSERSFFFHRWRKCVVQIGVKKRYFLAGRVPKFGLTWVVDFESHLEGFLSVSGQAQPAVCFYGEAIGRSGVGLISPVPRGSPCAR